MAILQWVLTLGLLAFWWSRGRSWRDLGFGLELTPGILAGGLLAAGALVAFRLYHHRQLADPGRRARLRRRMDRIAPFLPRARAGLPAFDRLSVTAGICEEILFRGFLLWYAGAYLGKSPSGLAAAVILTSLLFAFVHLYQGIAGMLTVGGVGLLQGTVFVLSGSLWIPMLLHALIDALAGRLSLRLHPEGEPGADAWGGRRAVLAVGAAPGERASGTAGRDA
jgi:membrane protease YdiL (CAAX protease family)